MKEQMKPLPIRNSSALQVGENVGAIGYSFEQLTFSVGSIKQVNILRDTIPTRVIIFLFIADNKLMRHLKHSE